MSTRLACASIAAALSLVACGDPSATENATAPGSKPAGSADAPAAQRTLRFSGIPDSDKDKLTQQYKAVADWLSAEIGMPVEYVHAPDYTGAVTALAADKIDFAWLGGVTAVEAETATNGQTIMLAARDTDLKFKSYFIANRAHVESGRFTERTDLAPQSLADLAALEPALKQGTFTFGSKSSTSGHIMPRHFLESPEVGIDPEKDFLQPAGYQLQGGHSATLAAVASGAVDVGVLNYTNWEKADAEQKAKAPLIYVSPEYVDYCMVAHARIGTDLAEKLRTAFAGLDAAQAADKAVLDAFAATSFVKADPKDWDMIREVLKSAKERGVLD
jgi:phosphonate transport system substrate-binding protein